MISKGGQLQENRLANYSLIFIALVLLAIVLQTFQSVLRPLAIATLLVFMVTPLARYSKQKKIPVWLTFSGLFLVVILLLMLISSFVVVENLDLKNMIPQFQEKISQSSGSILAMGSKLGFGPEDMTPEKLSTLAAKGAKVVLQAARTIFSETLLALILLMFSIQSYAALFRVIEKRFGKEEVIRLQTTFQKIEGDILAYLGTKAAMSLGTAVGTVIVLLLFKSPFIYTSALVIFVLNFIPVIGSMIAVIIVLIMYLLTVGVSANAAWLFLSLMAVQTLFGSILEPKIAGSRLNMSPVLIILSLYLWGWIWGIIGMLMSVPLTIVILIILRHMGPVKTGDLETVTTG